MTGKRDTYLLAFELAYVLSDFTFIKSFCDRAEETATNTDADISPCVGVDVIK